MSIKTDLIGEQFVQGNLKEALQVYKIYYYPPEQEHPSSKVWLYFNRKQDKSYFGIKSLCFSNIENHRNFILNNILYHLYWLEKQLENYRPSFMDSKMYRRKLLNALINDLINKINKKIERI